MNKNLTLAAVLGMVTVILGAFGAHRLKEILSPESLESFETGVRYMMYHVLVVLILNSNNLIDTKQKNRLSALFFMGILLFSGSIFVITLGLVPASSIWFITPLGGVLLIIGWALLAFSFFKKNS